MPSQSRSTQEYYCETWRDLGTLLHANDTFEAAERAGRKIVLTQDELVKYMTGWRKVDGAAIMAARRKAAILLKLFVPWYYTS